MPPASCSFFSAFNILSATMITKPETAQGSVTNPREALQGVLSKHLFSLTYVQIFFILNLIEPLQQIK